MASLLLVFVETAEVAQHGMRYVLGHLHAHAGVAQAHDRHRRQGIAQLEQRIDTGAHQEDRPHVRQLVEQGRRGTPDDGVIAWRQTVAFSPRNGFHLRHDGGEFARPWLGYAVSAVQEYAHLSSLIIIGCVTPL